MDVPYKWSDAQTWNFTIMLAMKWGMDYWVSYFLYCPLSPQMKLKPSKKHWSRTNVSMWRELTAITYNSFGALQLNKDFQAPLALANKVIPSF